MTAIKTCVCIQMDFMKTKLCFLKFYIIGRDGFDFGSIAHDSRHCASENTVHKDALDGDKFCL